MLFWILYSYGQIKSCFTLVCALISATQQHTDGGKISTWQSGNGNTPQFQSTQCTKSTTSFQAD
jgi:hypothetical protein